MALLVGEATPRRRRCDVLLFVRAKHLGPVAVLRAIRVLHAMVWAVRRTLELCARLPPLPPRDVAGSDPPAAADAVARRGRSRVEFLRRFDGHSDHVIQVRLAELFEIGEPVTERKEGQPEKDKERGRERGKARDTGGKGRRVSAHG